MNDSVTAMPNPWTSIWLRPRATIQHIVDTELEKRVVALAAGGEAGAGERMTPVAEAMS